MSECPSCKSENVSITPKSVEHPKYHKMECRQCGGTFWRTPKKTLFNTVSTCLKNYDEIFLKGEIEMNDRMLQWFEYSHLPANLQEASKPFCELANLIASTVVGGPERTVALRKLLEAKDAAVRAKLNPGG